MVHSTTSGVAHGMVSQDANNIVGGLWMEEQVPTQPFTLAPTRSRVENSKLVEELGRLGRSHVPDIVWNMA